MGGCGVVRFYEVDVFRETTIRFFSPYFGTEFIVRGFKVLKFAINALTALGNEMFRLTAETRGALLLMMMFFYSAFVLGATLFVETNMNSDLCQSMGHCTWTLVRLTFFDGDGLDFAYYLTSDHRILFFIVMVYLCITSFGILNGLVGVFGTALARASHLAFEDEEDPQDDGMGESVSPMRGDDEEISSRDGDGNNGQNGTKDKLIDEDEVVESFKGDVDPAPLFATAGPAGQAPGMTDDMKKSLRDILRGPSSRFAVEHFTKAADANAASSVADGTQSPAHGASNFGRMFGGGTPGKRRITIKDVARAVSSHNNNRPTGISVCDEPVEPRPLRAKPSAAPGTFANMFAVGGNGANRPLPAKSSRNLLGHHGSTQVAMLGGDGRSLMAGVAELHSKVDRQTKLINLLLRQVGTLTKQLEKVVPDFEASMDGNDVSSVMSSGYNVKDLLLDDTLDANPVASPAPSTARSGALGGVGLGSMSSGGRGSGTGGGMTGLLNRMKKPTAAAPAPVPSAAVAPAPMAPAAAAPAEPVHHPSPFNAAPTVLVDSMLEESSVVDEDGTGQPLYEAEQPPREDDRIQDFTES